MSISSATLEFEPPGGVDVYGSRRQYKMQLSEFVHKWINGVPIKCKRELDLSLIQGDQEYSAKELANIIGISETTINGACRKNQVKANKRLGPWYIKGDDFKTWRNTITNRETPELRRMQIRQLDEVTGLVTTSTVKNATYSGIKEVFEVQAGDKIVCGSADQRILTDTGWKRICELRMGVDEIITEARGARKKLTTVGNRCVGGRWVSHWIQKIKRERGPQICKCGKPTEQCHHIKPIHLYPELAFIEENLEFLCEDCHKEEHLDHSTYKCELYGKPILVDFIRTLGMQETYDLEINGPYHNFIIGGVVAHNSHDETKNNLKKLHEQLLNSELVQLTRIKPHLWVESDNNGVIKYQELFHNAWNNLVKTWYDTWLSVDRYKMYQAMEFKPSDYPEYALVREAIKKVNETWLQQRKATKLWQSLKKQK